MIIIVHQCIRILIISKLQQDYIDSIRTKIPVSSLIITMKCSLLRIIIFSWRRGDIGVMMVCEGRCHGAWPY